MNTRRIVVTFVALLAAAAVLPLVSLRAPIAADDPLPSWNETASKQAIMDFVAKVTKEGSSDFVKPAERIAVFDNDGTLWCEQPLYFQGFFCIDRVKALARQHPEWKDTEPFKSAIAGDLKGVGAAGAKGLHDMLAATHAGMTTDEFNTIVKDWLKTARHPKYNRPYTECIYQPMLEVLAYLRASGFKTFIVSGGGLDFMRAFAEEVYGIPPEQIIGTSGKTQLEMRDGAPVIVKLPELSSLDDKEGKPLNIELHIGRRPVMCFGNSDGDLQMLQWTTIPRGSADHSPRFGLIVRHTDVEREYAYDRDSHVGKLDKALDEAEQRGWTVVSMKDDWKTIFPASTAQASANSAPLQSHSITGTVAYRVRIAPPPDAVVHIKLEDVSQADAPATVIAEKRIATDGRQVPIPFTLEYDPAKIIANHRYNVRASIVSGDKTLFTTTQQYPVLTVGGPGGDRDLRIIVEQSGDGAPGR